MKKNVKKVYVSPSIKENIIELEQGIAAGSQQAQPGTPSVNDPGNGEGGSGFGDF